MSAIRLAFARFQHTIKIALIVIGLVVAISFVCATGAFIAVVMGVIHAVQSCH